MKFEIFLDALQQFRFRLLAKNGQTVASSEGYSTLQKCRQGIMSVKKCSKAQVVKVC